MAKRKKEENKRITPGRITELREKYDVSLKELAEHLNTHPTWIKWVEEGLVEVSPWDLIDLSSATLAVVVSKLAQERKKREQVEKRANRRGA